MAKPKRFERPHDPDRARDIRTAFSKAEGSALNRVVKMAARTDGDHLFFFMVDGTTDIGPGIYKAVEAISGAQRVSPATATASWSDRAVRWLRKDPAPLIDGKRPGYLEDAGLSRAADEMARLAEAARFIGKIPHFFILTGGNITDAAQAETKLESLLRAYPEATLETVVYRQNLINGGELYEDPTATPAWKMTTNLFRKFGHRITAKGPAVNQTGWHDLRDSVRFHANHPSKETVDEAMRIFKAPDTVWHDLSTGKKTKGLGF